MKILLADDDVVSRRILQVFFVKQGHEVVLADDGEQALRILDEANDPPRLALLDWLMPGVDGVEVCRAIRQRNPEPYIYVVLLTAKAQRQDIVQGMDAGADDYIIKPFDLMELRARLGAGFRILDLHDRIAAAHQELRFKALHDALTGLSNRGAITEALEAELVRAARLKSTLAVIMADLDHFKKVNDTHGHLVGDAVLAEAARRMRAALRSYDLIGRYGGEEFLIVLPEVDPIRVPQHAERLREAVSRDPFPTTAGPLRVTVSLGVALAGGSLTCAAEAVLRAADEALCTAKQAGRDRVACAGPSRTT